MMNRLDQARRLLREIDTRFNVCEDEVNIIKEALADFIHKHDRSKKRLETHNIEKSSQ